MSDTFVEDGLAEDDVSISSIHSVEPTPDTINSQYFYGLLSKLV